MFTYPVLSQFLTSEALLSNFRSLEKILFKSLKWLLTDLDFFFLGPDVLYSTDIMKVECICEQNCASSVCVAILGQGHGLMENYHSRNSDLLAQTEQSAVEI